MAARASGAELVPVASFATRAIRIRSAWEDFHVPLPFSRVAVVAGPSVPPLEALRSPELLARRIDEAHEAAVKLAGSGSSRRVTIGEEMS